MREGGSPVAAGLPELSFVHPLPGFPGLKRYVLVRIDDAEAGETAADAPAAEAMATAVAEAADALADAAQSPETAAAADAAAVLAAADADAVLFEMRCVEKPELSFLVGVPRAFFPEYSIELDDQSCDDLDIKEPADALVLVILSAGTDPAATTANLLAPVVINGRTRAAAQIILSGTDWPVRAPLA
jgi:flagellar assembly factor FliW